jgi:hypothetical protein
MALPLLVWSIVSAGCCHTTTTTATTSMSASSIAQPSQKVMTMLLFGMSVSDGASVSEQQWQTFLNDVVTPRFPAGLTVLTGSGQYMPDKGPPLVFEQSKVLLLVHEASDGASTRIREIKAEYCRRFHQESVLQIHSPVDVEF